MSRKRTYDWDEARKRREAGERIADIAASYGVSESSVYHAINARTSPPGYCEKCGASIRSVYARHCKPCSAVERRTTVRDETLQCIGCREWKPDEEFWPNKRTPARRYRNGYCKQCEVRKRRERRHKNPESTKQWQNENRAKNIERARAYSRDYYQKNSERLRARNSEADRRRRAMRKSEAGQDG